MSAATLVPFSRVHRGLLVVACTVLIAYLTTCRLSQPAGGEASQSSDITPSLAPPSQVCDKQKTCWPDFSRVFERASQSVVNISAAHGLPIPEELLPKGNRQVIRAMAKSLGSGFFIDDKGHIVTCSSVIADAEDIEVTTSDKRTLQAQLLKQDATTDLAVLRVQPSAAKPALMPSTKKLWQGDWVAAIGYPFGLSHSVTSGIVSATKTAQELGASHGLILTDAAINPGCNGGPLIDQDGHVVGINLIEGNTQTQYGRALPFDEVWPTIDKLRQGLSPQFPWLGISIQYVDATLAAALGMHQAQGALITRITPGGPAERAGLKAGDVIIAYHRRRVEDPKALIDAVSLSVIGRKTKMVIIRNGQKTIITIRPQASN